MCTMWAATGKCAKADKCNYAHGEHELRRSVTHAAALALQNCGGAFHHFSIQPTDQARYKIKLCQFYHETGRCKFGDKCFYAHGSNELRMYGCE